MKARKMHAVGTEEMNCKPRKKRVEGKKSAGENKGNKEIGIEAEKKTREMRRNGGGGGCMVGVANRRNNNEANPVLINANQIKTKNRRKHASKNRNLKKSNN